VNETRNQPMLRLRVAIAENFQSWYEEFERGEKDSHCLMNNRI
jgi:hypothetical protein